MEGVSILEINRAKFSVVAADKCTGSSPMTSVATRSAHNFGLVVVVRDCVTAVAYCHCFPKPLLRSVGGTSRSGEVRCSRFRCVLGPPSFLLAFVRLLCVQGCAFCVAGDVVSCAFRFYKVQLVHLLWAPTPGSYWGL